MKSETFPEIAGNLSRLSPSFGKIFRPSFLLFVLLSLFLLACEDGEKQSEVDEAVITLAGEDALPPADGIFAAGGVLKGHTDTVYASSVSPVKYLLATGSRDQSIKLWNLETQTLDKTLVDSGAVIHALAFSPDGTKLASGGSDNRLRVWDVDAGNELQSLAGHTDTILSLAYSPDGSRIATGSSDTNIRIWKTSDYSVERVITGHTGFVYTLAFNSNGSELISGSADDRVKIWRTSDGANVFDSVTNEDVHEVAFINNNYVIAAGDEDKTYVFDRGGGNFFIEAFHTDDVKTLLVSPKLDRVFTAGKDRRLREITFANPSRPSFPDITSKVLGNHADTIRTLAISRSGRTLISAGADKDIRIWVD